MNKRTKSRRKPDVVQMEREALILAGDAGAKELMRRVKSALDQSPFSQSDSPIYLAEVRRRRYASGGLHSRLKAASVQRSIIDNGARESEYKCFIGRGRCNAKGERYEA